MSLCEAPGSIPPALPKPIPNPNSFSEFGFFLVWVPHLAVLRTDSQLPIFGKWKQNIPKEARFSPSLHPASPQSRRPHTHFLCGRGLLYSGPFHPQGSWGGGPSWVPGRPPQCDFPRGPPHPGGAQVVGGETCGGQCDRFSTSVVPSPPEIREEILPGHLRFEETPARCPFSGQ